MKMDAARWLLCLIALGAGTVASGVAHAQTTTNQAVSITCTGGGQLCNNIATINVTTTGLLQAQFVGSSFLCSNVRIHFLVDAIEVAVTPFVGASGSTGIFNLGPVSAGSHVLGLQAEGQAGGCNVGTLGGWSGTASVTVNAPVVAANSIPTLSQWGVTVLLGLLGLLGLLQLRRSGRRV
jgi:hypothetical protein